MLPKKGDLQDLNKWRCINLMDVGSKILSCILTERAYKLLERHGVKTQFGATPLVGCQDANFTLKTLLHLRRQHNLDSYVAFVDLVKAYDTANHSLLVELLGRYGAPPEFCNVIERLYNNLSVTITVEGKQVTIPQTSGVRQGDNLSPVLFLFIMSAVAESLNQTMIEHEIKRVSCHRVILEELQSGSLIGHSASSLKKGEVFHLLEMLFIDDGAFIFNSREDLTKGLKLIIKQFAHFGLEVHIGTGEIASKTECVYFPKPSKFAPNRTLTIEAPAQHQMLTDTPTSPHNPQHTETAIITYQNPTHSELIVETQQRKDPKRTPVESDKARKARLDAEYPTWAETQRIILENDSFVDFSKEFTYLGSNTSYDLIDGPDIKRRITKASQSMGMLNNLWNNPHIDLKTKHSFFLAIPINLLLWGCEAWALKEADFQKLDAFLHRSVRRILGINMTRVKDEHIKNEKIREEFFHLPDIRRMIAIRQLNYIGKALRHPNQEHLPKQLLPAWVNNKRPQGGVLTTNKKSLVKALDLLYSTKSKTDPFDGAANRMDRKGTIGLWLDDALNEARWNWLIDCQLRRPHLKINEPTTNRQNTNQNHQRQPPPSPPNNHHRRRHRFNQPPSPRINRTNTELSQALHILELEAPVNEREATVRYRQLCRKYHPDKVAISKLTVEEANTKFQQINNAFEVIKHHLRL
jgi:hypothetical protein